MIYLLKKKDKPIAMETKKVNVYIKKKGKYT